MIVWTQEAVVEAQLHEARLAAQEDEKNTGFVSSRTASVRGAIASLGNMAIAEDMNFATMFKQIDVSLASVLFFKSTPHATGGGACNNMTGRTP
jgi:hypothetical protein